MTVTGIITALIVGLIIGALGRLVVPGRQRIPIWLTMLIGVGAALLGSAIDTARRTRSQFERLAGVQASYSPAAARRARATRQTAALARPSEIS